MAIQPFPLDFQLGVQRDGTKFDAKRYLDALWCRWRLGRPRKMGGYRQITGAIPGLPRRIHGYYAGPLIYWHIGTTTSLIQVVTDQFGNFLSTANRTPARFQGGPEIGWSLDGLFDTTSNAMQLIAHAVQDRAITSFPVPTTPYLGIISSTTQLVPFSNPGVTTPASWMQPSVAGGIACVQPFVFDFDVNGFVGWSAPNLALYLGVTGGTSGAGQARVSAQKIVACMPLRGGGAQQPAALIWSLSEVITASYVGSPVWFAFSTVSSSSSIVSHESVVEYDGLYFWCGVDRFLVFNGTVSEVPNPQNQDWFFDNITPGYEAGIHAFKIPRYGEIWWCAPMFGSTVPNYAVIFNVRENSWYDTALPDGGRGAGLAALGFSLPVMTDVTNNSGNYGFWLHETGHDKQINNTLTAIRSYYETGWFGGPVNTPPSDGSIAFSQLEPDLVQTGPLSTWLIGAANARSPEVAGPALPLPQVPASPQEAFVSFTPTMPTRLLRLHVESNVLGGSFVAGRNLGHGQAGDKRLAT